MGKVHQSQCTVQSTGTNSDPDAPAAIHYIMIHKILRGLATHHLAVLQCSMHSLSC
jgi:hypothetical protein